MALKQHRNFTLWITVYRILCLHYIYYVLLCE